MDTCCRSVPVPTSTQLALAPNESVGDVWLGLGPQTLIPATLAKGLRIAERLGCGRFCAEVRRIRYAFGVVAGLKYGLGRCHFRVGRFWRI
jgi:hypothetical protein